LRMVDFDVARDDTAKHQTSQRDGEMGAWRGGKSSSRSIGYRDAGKTEVDGMIDALLKPLPNQEHAIKRDTQRCTILDKRRPYAIRQPAELHWSLRQPPSDARQQTTRHHQHPHAENQQPMHGLRGMMDCQARGTDHDMTS
jgi:hypothetical protein